MKKSATIVTLAVLMSACATTQTHEVKTPKSIVTSFFDLAFVKRKPIEAANQYVSAEMYIQHNPHGADGRDAFIEGFASYILSSNYSCEVKRVIAEKALVVVHSHCKENLSDNGSAIVDIFRVDDGLIVEHWDVEQVIPVKSKNNNTMF